MLPIHANARITSPIFPPYPDAVSQGDSPASSPAYHVMRLNKISLSHFRPHVTDVTAFSVGVGFCVPFSAYSYWPTGRPSETDRQTVRRKSCWSIRVKYALECFTRRRTLLYELMRCAT